MCSSPCAPPLTRSPVQAFLSTSTGPGPGAGTGDSWAALARTLQGTASSDTRARPDWPPGASAFPLSSWAAAILAALTHWALCLGCPCECPQAGAGSDFSLVPRVTQRRSRWAVSRPLEAD